MIEVKKTLRSIVAFVLIFAVLNMSISCNYFKVHSYYAPEAKAQSLEIDPNDYIIIHIGYEMYHLNNLVLDQDKHELRGVKAVIEDKHLHVADPDHRGNRYKNGNMPYNEVHIYTSAVQEENDGSVIVPMSKIERLDIYDREIGTTVASYAFGAIGVLSIFSLVVGILTSCPFIYVENNGQYVFYGEIYGGAISSNLERNDYMPLPQFQHSNGLYNIKLTNELHERQYTDIAELILVEHNKDTRVLMDARGALYSINAPVSPISASSERVDDYLSVVSVHDSIAYPFTDAGISNADFSNITLKFPKAAGASQGKLVLTLKNSLWLDYIFGRFFAQFGNRYDDFVKNQKDVPAEDKIKWAEEQGIMLDVKIKTAHGWETIEYVNMIGPLASRTIVLPVDLSDHASDMIEIKMECGFHFWELDYAAMDYSSNAELVVKKLETLKAEDENGANLLPLLSYNDNRYLEQPYIGAQAFISYKAEQLTPNKTASLFLHTSGYYEYIRNYKGRPNVAELQEFRNPGAFARFAKENFLEMAGTN